MTQNSINTLNPVRQVVSAVTTARVTCATDIPVDDSIPEKTEGDEVLTLAITPISATSNLLIMISLNESQETGTGGTLALFQDAITNALAATQLNNMSPAGSMRGSTSLIHFMAAGTTSSTTFKIRCGPGAALGTVFVNGDVATRLYGGVASTTMTIFEFLT